MQRTMQKTIVRIESEGNRRRFFLDCGHSVLTKIKLSIVGDHYTCRTCGYRNPLRDNGMMTRNGKKIYVEKHTNKNQESL
jgi:hypothetical protein